MKRKSALFVLAAAAAPVAPDRVCVMTPHRAKGLEFAGVVVAEINKDVWSYRDGEYDDLDAVAKRIEDEGELSLLYVAMTRAMTHVFLTGVGPATAKLAT